LAVFYKKFRIHLFFDNDFDAGLGMGLEYLSNEPNYYDSLYSNETTGTGRDDLFNHFNPCGTKGQLVVHLNSTFFKSRGAYWVANTVLDKKSRHPDMKTPNFNFLQQFMVFEKKNIYKAMSSLSA
jgi:hypothetical protein